MRRGRPPACPGWPGAGRGRRWRADRRAARLLRRARRRPEPTSSGAVQLSGRAGAGSGARPLSEGSSRRSSAAASAAAGRAARVLAQQRVEGGGRAAGGRTGQRRRCGGDLPVGDRVGVALPGERRGAGHQLVPDDAGGVHVGGGGDQLVGEDLGRHVLRGADHPGHADGRLLRQARDAEVGQLHQRRVVVGEQHVVGLDVAVQHPAAVGVGQRVEHVDDQPGGLGGGEPAAGVEQPGAGPSRARGP